MRKRYPTYLNGQVSPVNSIGQRRLKLTRAFRLLPYMYYLINRGIQAENRGNKTGYAYFIVKGDDMVINQD
jgi:hypothetical protein